MARDQTLQDEIETLLYHCFGGGPTGQAAEAVLDLIHNLTPKETPTMKIHITINDATEEDVRRLFGGRPAGLFELYGEAEKIDDWPDEGEKPAFRHEQVAPGAVAYDDPGEGVAEGGTPDNSDGPGTVEITGDDEFRTGHTISGESEEGEESLVELFDRQYKRTDQISLSDKSKAKVDDYVVTEEHGPVLILATYRGRAVALTEEGREVALSTGEMFPMPKEENKGTEAGGEEDSAPEITADDVRAKLKEVGAKVSKSAARDLIANSGAENISAMTDKQRGAVMLKARDLLQKAEA